MISVNGKTFLMMTSFLRKATFYRAKPQSIGLSWWIVRGIFGEPLCLYDNHK
jgi:hypothetical protein